MAIPLKNKCNNLPSNVENTFQPTEPTKSSGGYTVPARLPRPRTSPFKINPTYSHISQKSLLIKR